MAEIIDFLYCPIMSSDIDIGLCQDIQFVTDGDMIEEILDFKLSSEQKKTCKNCKKRIDPAL